MLAMQEEVKSNQNGRVFRIQMKQEPMQQILHKRPYRNTNHETRNVRQYGQSGIVRVILTCAVKPRHSIIKFEYWEYGNDHDYRYPDDRNHVPWGFGEPFDKVGVEET